VFLFLFHSFYGRYQLVLYSPVIMCIYVSMFLFITEILSNKMTISLCCPLLAIMIYFNFPGLYTMHCINQYVFGSSDIVFWQEAWVGTNINMLKKHIENYKGNRILLYRVFYED
jgi:hypothetical protein